MPKQLLQHRSVAALTVFGYFLFLFAIWWIQLGFVNTKLGRVPHWSNYQSLISGPYAVDEWQWCPVGEHQSPPVHLSDDQWTSTSVAIPDSIYRTGTWFRARWPESPVPQATLTASWIGQISFFHDASPLAAPVTDEQDASTYASAWFPGMTLLPTNVDPTWLYLRHESINSPRVDRLVWQALLPQSVAEPFRIVIAPNPVIYRAFSQLQRNRELIIVSAVVLLLMALYSLYLHLVSRTFTLSLRFLAYTVFAVFHGYGWYAFNTWTPGITVYPIFVTRWMLIVLTIYMGIYLTLDYFTYRPRIKPLYFLLASHLLLPLSLMLETNLVWLALALTVLYAVAVLIPIIRRSRVEGLLIAFTFWGLVGTTVFWFGMFLWFDKGIVPLGTAWFLLVSYSMIMIWLVMSKKYRLFSTELQEKVAEAVILQQQADLLQRLAERKVLAHQELQQTTEQLKEQLEARTRELIQSERQAAFGQFVQGIVHNMRNPLTAVLGTNELNLSTLKMLQGFSRTPTVTRLMRELEEGGSIITDATQKLADMVDSLMSKSRDDQQNLTTTFDLNALVSQEYDFLRADDELRHQIHVEFDFCPEPLLLTAVRSDLAQAIQNLITNARDALHGVNNPRLLLKTSQRDGFAVLEITDNGGGIPAEIQDRIFDPFFSTKAKEDLVPFLEPAQTPFLGGSGLGLWITQQTVELMDGEVLFRTEQGVGTTFELRFPHASYVPS